MNDCYIFLKMTPLCTIAPRHVKSNASHRVSFVLGAPLRLYQLRVKTLRCLSEAGNRATLGVVLHFPLLIETQM